MKKLYLIPYALLRWTIILIFMLSVLLVFTLESTTTVLEILKTPLKEQGLEYGKLRGGLLSGFVLEDVNYKNQVKAKKMQLKVDWKALRNRVLWVDNLVLEDAEIDKDFLASLLESKGTESKSSEGNFSLPFDRVIVNNANISVKNIIYDAYKINRAKLHIDHLDTDMKEKHKGVLTFMLDSNVSQLDLKGSFKNDHYDIVAKVEGEKKFIDTFLVDSNAMLLSNPDMTIHAKGDLKEVHYDVDVHRLDIKFEAYRVESQKLHTSGVYHVVNKELVNALDTVLVSNVGRLTLRGDTSLDIDDVNNTLLFDIDGKFIPKKSHLIAGLAEKNISIEQFPTLLLLAKGDMKYVDFSTKVQGLKATQNEMRLWLKELDIKGHAKPLHGDVDVQGYTSFDSSIANGFIDFSTRLNYKDINHTLVFDAKADLDIHGAYVNNFLSDANVTLEGDSKFKLLAKGDFDNVEFSTSLKSLNGKQNDIIFALNDLDIKGNAKPFQGDIALKAYSQFDSSIADGLLNLTTSLNYKEFNSTLEFDTDTDLNIHGAYVNKFLHNANVSLHGESQLQLNASGNLERVEFTSLLQEVNGEQNDLLFHVKHLNLQGDAHPLQGDINVIGNTVFDSSATDGSIHLNTSLNYKDINASLEFDTKANLAIHGEYLNNFLNDANVTLVGDSQLSVRAKGDLNHVSFTTLLEEVNGKQNDIDFSLTDLDVKGEAQPLEGESSVTALTHFSSSVADGEVKAKVKLNFHDINNSLELATLAKLDIHAGYLNPLLKEQGVALEGESHLEVQVDGTLNHLMLNVDAQADVLKDKKVSSIRLHASPILLNLLSHEVSGSLDIVSKGGNIGLNVKTNFSGDYTKPKEMEIQNKIEVEEFNAFGVNLNSLQPLVLEMQNRGGALFITLDSPKIQLRAKSDDNDYFTFELKTQSIDFSKIIELPEELSDKFIEVDVRGEVTLSKEYFTVKGFIASNEEFKLYLDAINNQNGLDAKLSTEHLRVIATGNLAKKDIKVKLSIDSLRAVQEEFVKLYAFNTVEIDGALVIDASLRNEEVFASVASKKLILKDFNVEGLQLDAHYKKDLLTLRTFNFKTRGFSESDLNQNFYLNQKALIHLGKRRDILLDMHPNIYLKAEGTKENLTGDFQIKKLPIGYPEYGSMILNCNINYRQFGLKREITGDVLLRKMKLFYEAKFLDADYDSDVVIITKKDKKKKKQRDTFLEDTYIDLAIKAPDAKYVTRDIDLEFTVDVGAKKEFGENLGMVGQIRDINGRVEQAPKLFNVVDSNIVFGGGQEINPLLDIQVNYTLPDVLISIFIHGNAKRPKLDFSSEPPMPKKDILSYLVLGVSTASLAEGEGSLGREAELFIMNQAARDLAYEVELDRVFIKDDGTGEGYAIEVGKKINDKTMFVIENSKEGNSFILEYEVNKNIKVEVGQHQKTVPSQSIDIFFRKKFK